MQGSGDVAAPVKRLALDHDLSQPVPTAAAVSQDASDAQHALDAELYEDPAHSREDLGLQVSPQRLKMKNLCDRSYFAYSDVSGTDLEQLQ